MDKIILEKLKNEVDINSYAHNKVCISFVGGPGYGKSTISKTLCEKMNLFHCSNDYIARNLENAGLDISNYEEKTKLISSIAFPFQDFLFEHNIGFVLDANLMLYLDVLQSRCKKYNYKLYIIEINISKEEALRRVLKRLEEHNNANLSNSDADDFQLFLKQYEEYKKIENKEYIFDYINMEENDILNQIERIIERINNE